MKKQEMYMEDVGKISVELVELAQELLKPFKTRLDDDAQLQLIESELFDVIFNKLEYFCDNDYRQHN